MISPNVSSQEPQEPQEPQALRELPLEHWAVIPKLPLLSGPTVPTVGRRSCVPRVISIVTIPLKTSGDSTLNNCTRQGFVLTHQPGTPLSQLWPSLTPPQRETVKAELCRLLVRMRSRRFSYYGRPTKQPYVLFSEVAAEKFACCASRIEWDDSRVHALQEYAPDSERAVNLERVQRGTAGAGGWDRPVLTHGDLSDRNILVDPDTLAVTGFLDWEMANIMPAYFEYVAARLSGGHQPAWRKELLDVLRSVLRCECDTVCRDDLLGVKSDDGHDRYGKTLAAWDAVVDVERIAQGYDDDCEWTFER